MQIKVVSFDVFGGVGADAGLLLVGGLQFQGGCERAVDLVFKGQEIAGRTRKFLAPQTASGGGVVEAEGNAKVVTIALHATLQDKIDAKCAG